MNGVGAILVMIFIVLALFASISLLVMVLVIKEFAWHSLSYIGVMLVISLYPLIHFISGI
jgi:hypothetical protein